MNKTLAYISPGDSNSISSADLISECTRHDYQDENMSPNILFGTSPSSPEDRDDIRSSIKHGNFFEDCTESTFSGIFGMENMSISENEPSFFEDRKKKSKYNDFSHVALQFDSTTSQWKPSKRQRQDSFTSPQEIIDVPITPCSDEFKLNSPEPSARMAVIETPSKDRHSICKLDQEDSQMDAGQSRLMHDFEIVNVIGTGTFGTVYRAKGRLDNVVYAVKRSRRRFKGRMDRDHMMHEVHALAALSSKEDADKTMTIVRYYSAWIEDGHVCIQMELCDTSVDSMLMTPYQFDETELFHLCRDVLLALQLLHSNDFVHLDIKPANILKKNSHYKLGDFGLALHTDHGKVRGGVEEGDSRYMARELLNWNSTPDLTKCDIFSLGITMLELASRQQVAAEGPDWHYLRNGISADAVELANCSSEMSNIIQALMEAEPENRPAATTCLENFTKLKSNIERELLFFQRQAARLSKQLKTSAFIAAPTAAPKPKALRRCASQY